MLRVKGLDKENPQVVYCLIGTLNKRHCSLSEEYLQKFKMYLLEKLPFTMSYFPFKEQGDTDTEFFLTPIDIDNENVDTNAVLYSREQIHEFAELFHEVLPREVYTSVEHLQNSFVPSTATIH